MIEGHGNNIHNPGINIVKDFSSNVVSSIPHHKLLDFLAGKISGIANYPEPFSESLRKKIACKHNVKPSNVLVTNGSTEAFYLIATAFNRNKSLIVIPSFSEYYDACSIHNHNIELVTLKEFEKSIKSDIDLIWLGNPNNPDGNVADYKGLMKKLIDFPNTNFVIDEAYGDLCEGFKSMESQLNAFSNLIIVKSLTKMYSIPGLRLGYILAAEEIISKLQKYLLPWNVNTMAIEAGKFIIDNENDLMPDVSQILNQSKNLQLKFSQCDKLEVVHSSCNFFLVRLKKGKASELKDYLLGELGFLIRDASNFIGLDKSYFRIAVQDEASDLKLYEAIRNWLNTQE